MKTKKSFPANHTILFFISGFILILLMISGYLYYNRESSRMKDEQYNNLKAISELKVNQILQWWSERLSDANVLSKSSFIISSLQQKQHNEDISKTLTIAKNSYKYEEIFIVNSKFDLLYLSNSDIKQFDPSCKLNVFNIKEIREIQSTDFYYCPSHNKVHFDLIAPIKNDKNIILGYLIFRTDPYKYLYPLIQSWPNNGKTSETLLVRRDGDSVLFLNELKYKKNTACFFKVPLANLEIPATRAVLGEQGIFEGKDYRGVEVLSDIRSIPGTPWFMVAKVDKEEIFHDLRTISWIIAAVILLLMILFGVGLAWFYNRRQSNFHIELLMKDRALDQFQKEYRTTLYSIGDAVITTDPNGLVKIMNSEAEKLTGWKESESTDKPIEEIFNIINEYSRERIETPIKKILKDGIVIGLANHTLLLSKDGSEIPIADSGAPVKDENGETTGVVLVFRDQTEERNRQNELILSEERYRKLYTSINDGIALHEVIYDQSGSPINYKIIDVNPKYTEITNIDRDSCIGKLATETYGTSNPPYLEIYAGVASTGNPAGFETYFEPMNKYFQISVFSPSRGSFATVFKDISETKRAENALRESEEKFRLTFQTSPDSININRLGDGLYIDVNDGFTNLTGFTREDVIGKTSKEINIWNNLDDRKKLVEGLLEKGFYENLEAKFKRKDGVLVTALMSARIISLNSVPHIISITKNIEDRKHMEESLRESREKYKAIADFTYDWEFWTGVNKEYIYVSPSVERITGYSADCFFQDSDFLSKIVYYEDLEKVKSHLDHSMGSGPKYIEFRIRSKTKELKWIGHVCQHINDEKGNYLGIRGSNRDITEAMKEKEETLRLAAVIEQAVETITITDTTGNIQFINLAFENSYGIQKEIILGKNLFDPTLNLFDNDTLNSLAPVLNKRSSWLGRVNRIKNNGDKIVESAIISPIYNRTGQIINYVMICKDITHENSLENQLRQSQKMEAIGTLAGGIAHDFNNILTSIIGNTDLLLDEISDNDAQKPLLEKIMSGAKRASSLANQILAFSRKTDSKHESIFISEIINDVLKLIRSSFPSNIDIVQDIDPMLLPILGDPTQIHQIILNLATNAKDAMLQQGGTLKIELKNSPVRSDKDFNSKTEKFVCLAISDSGEGIDKSIMDRIFEPYFTTKGIGKGTGLGLAVVHGNIKNHRGTITVESEKGKGTKFTILFPALDFAPNNKPKIINNIHPHGIESILVIDDEENIVDVLQQMLSKYGYQVTKYTSSIDALEDFKKNPEKYDIVISDMTMPGIIGTKLSKEIKMIKPNIPVIICTGFSDILDESTIIQFGIDLLLNKPVAKEDLLKSIRNILDLKSTRL
jgi:two-component system, cell cycle sensor histidine kinase and response regulator CckA